MAKMAVPKNKGNLSAGANHSTLLESGSGVEKMKYKMRPRPTDWTRLASTENGDKNLKDPNVVFEFRKLSVFF